MNDPQSEVQKTSKKSKNHFKIEKDKLDCGFIYPVIEAIIAISEGLNLVNLFKAIGRRLGKTKEEEDINCNIAIDVYMALKWLIISYLLITSQDNTFSVFLTFYLIITNLSTYFYHHVWIERAYSPFFTFRKLRRRFINLILALAFSNYCYIYLYYRVFNNDIKWPGEINRLVSTIQFSFSNSIAGSYNNMYPTTTNGSLIATSQLVITFLFITIILARSIPQASPNNSNDNGGN